VLFARDRGGGLAFEVDVGLAAHIDGGEVDRAAGEGPGPLAGVVVGDRVELRPTVSPEPVRPNVAGWVLIRCSPTFLSP
jgi:hypothetical protein